MAKRLKKARKIKKDSEWAKKGDTDSFSKAMGIHKNWI